MKKAVRPHPTADARKYQTFKKEVFMLLQAKGMTRAKAEAALKRWSKYVHERWKMGKPPCAISDHLARWEKEKIVCPCKKAGCKGKACKTRKMVRGEVSQGGSVRKMTRAEVARFMTKANKEMVKYGRPGTVTTLDSKGRIASRVPLRDPSGYLIMVYGRWGSEPYAWVDTLAEAKRKAQAASLKDPRDEYVVELEPGGAAFVYKAGKLHSSPSRDPGRWSLVAFVGGNDERGKSGTRVIKKKLSSEKTAREAARSLSKTMWMEGYIDTFIHVYDPSGGTVAVYYNGRDNERYFRETKYAKGSFRIRKKTR